MQALASLASKLSEYMGTEPLVPENGLKTDFSLFRHLPCYHMMP